MSSRLQQRSTSVNSAYDSTSSTPPSTTAAHGTQLNAYDVSEAMGLIDGFLLASAANERLVDAIVEIGSYLIGMILIAVAMFIFFYFFIL